MRTTSWNGRSRATSAAPPAEPVRATGLRLGGAASSSLPIALTADRRSHVVSADRPVAATTPHCRTECGLDPSPGCGRIPACWFAQSYLPSGGIDQGFFDGRPIVDLEASIALDGGATLALGARNAFNTYPDEGARAIPVGEKCSEYTPWGFNGACYYVRVGYGWGG